jgi:DNA-binding GntR family transcriptional regulator
MLPRLRSALLAKLVVDHPGRPQVILGELRRLILEGAVPPGTVISLREVAELFDVGHMPVRGALQTLIGEGLVRHDSSSGYTVAQPISEEMNEMWLVRRTAEKGVLVAASAQVSADQRARVMDAYAQLERALRDDDPAAYHRLTRPFRIALAVPSRMLRMLHVLETTWNITEPAPHMVQLAHADRVRLHTDNVRLLDAYLAGDTERLVEAMQCQHRRLEQLVAGTVIEAEMSEPPGDIPVAR